MAVSVKLTVIAGPAAARTANRVFVCLARDWKEISLNARFLQHGTMDSATTASGAAKPSAISAAASNKSLRRVRFDEKRMGMLLAFYK